VNVLCVFVHGNVPFTSDYVVRLRSMMRRHLPTQHEFTCLTDSPESLPRDMRTVKISRPENFPGWWSKLEIFSPEHELSGPSIYVDLDVLVVRSLELLADVNSTLTLIPHEGDFNGRLGLQVVKKYNSSVMVCHPDRLRSLYCDWNHGVTRRLWGDQDWIAERMPSQPTFPLGWFPRLSAIRVPAEGRPRWPEEAKIVLCKRPKNHDANIRWNWFEKCWQ
jgi:hypothetical protein